MGRQGGIDFLPLTTGAKEGELEYMIIRRRPSCCWSAIAIAELVKAIHGQLNKVPLRGDWRRDGSMARLMDLVAQAEPKKRKPRSRTRDVSVLMYTSGHDLAAEGRDAELSRFPPRT